MTQAPRFGGGSIQVFETAALFNGGIDHITVDANRQLDRHDALFFITQGRSRVFRFLTITGNFCTGMRGAGYALMAEPL